MSILKNVRILYGYNPYFSGVKRILYLLSFRTNTGASPFSLDIFFQLEMIQHYLIPYFSKIKKDIPLLIKKGVSYTW